MLHVSTEVGIVEREEGGNTRRNRRVGTGARGEKSDTETLGFAEMYKNKQKKEHL